MSYTKLFGSIVTSTIWTEDADTCKVWVTMLATADKHGEVMASIPGLAQISALPLESVESAIAKFLSPDKYSRTKDDEGRRIEEIDGGWLLLNHGKYRAMASKDEALNANAVRQARFREKKKRNAKVTDSNTKVTSGNGAVTPERDIAEAESRSRKQKKTAGTNIPPNPLKGEVLPHGGDFADSWKRWKQHRSEIKKPLKPTMMASQLKKLGTMTETDAVAMIEHTIEKGWQGMVDPKASAPAASKPARRRSNGLDEDLKL